MENLHRNTNMAFKVKYTLSVNIEHIMCYLVDLHVLCGTPIILFITSIAYKG